MDLELKHLGQTLAVGGFALYGSWRLMQLCGWRFAPELGTDTTDKMSVQKAAVYLALIFAAGIFLEDLSKNYSAERTGKDQSPVNTFLNWILDTDKELRFRSVVEITKADDNVFLGSPKPILKEILSIPLTDQLMRPHQARINSALVKDNSGQMLSVKGVEATKQLKNSINAIYYLAKNRVFREPSYFTELLGIENRIDFCRAFVFVCLILACANILVLVGSALPIKWFAKASKNRAKLFALLVLYCVGVWIASVSYESEHTNFNLRVFGYYVSMAGSNTSANAQTPN